MKKKPRRGKYAAKKLQTTALLWRIAVILLIIDVIGMGALHLNRYKARSEYQQMAAVVQELREATQPAVPTEVTVPPEPVEEELPTEPTEAASPTEPTQIGTEPTEPTEVTEPDDGLLAQYRQLYKENPEMVGWVRIDGTVLDYPVMYTPNDPEKYLHKNMKGEYSYPGVPFIDYRCKLDSDNLLIYGHNMADDTMFHTLVEYRQRSFWLEHPVIRFDSVYEEREFEVVAVFYDRVYYAHEKDFKFYNFIDAKNKADFNKSVKELTKKSIYKTGITPEYGQQLITLVTCTYQEDNGRFVVVAREKPKS